MPLKFTRHDSPETVEEELRHLSRTLDGFMAGGDDGISPVRGAIVRSWTHPMNYSVVLASNAMWNRRTPLVTIAAPAFTHLDLWVAMERSFLSDAVAWVTVGPTTGVRQLNGPAGADVPYREATVRVHRGNVSVERGRGMCYQFGLQNFAYTRQEPVVATAPSWSWGDGDLAFFPLVLGGQASQGSLALRVDLANPAEFEINICLRGFLTGRYIEHPVRPLNRWACPH